MGGSLSTRSGAKYFFAIKSRMFTIREATRAEAIDFWARSSRASVFVAPEILETLGPRCEWWIVEKGSEPFLLWPVALDGKGQPCLPSFSYYVGPVWSDTAMSRAPSSRFSDRLKVYELCTEFLVERYHSLLFELSPQLLDVRAFSWWNYGQVDSHRFSIEPRYTAQLRNLQAKAEEEIVLGFRELRRREIKRVNSEGRFSIHSDVGWDEIVDLYCRVFNDQAIDVEPQTQQVLDRLGELVATKWATLTVAKERDSEITVSAIFTLRAKGVSNLVLNLTRPDFKKSGVGPWTVVHSIMGAKSLGDEVFDFNGANSPRRGDDKHSYGAEDVLFFRLSFPGA